VQFEALVDLAEVYTAAGDVKRARESLEAAADLAQLKEATVPLRNVRLLLDGLSRQSAQPVN
jgi:hypothetical protein